MLSLTLANKNRLRNIIDRNILINEFNNRKKKIIIKHHTRYTYHLSDP